MADPVVEFETAEREAEQPYIAFMQDYYYRAVEDEFNANVFESGSAEDKIDEVNCKRVATNKLIMSMMRITFENIPQYIVQIYLQN